MRACQGEYRDGAKHGPWIWWHDSGVRSRDGQYLNNKAHGAWRAWDEDGDPIALSAGLRRQVAVGESEQYPDFWDGPNDLHPEWKTEVPPTGWLEGKHWDREEFFSDSWDPHDPYAEDGSLRGDRKVGEWTDKDRWGGRAEGKYSKGVREGQWTFWWVNGVKRKEGKFKNGLMQGTWSWWDSRSALMRKAQFKDGVPHGDWAGWELKGSFCDGERSGRWETDETGDYADGVRQGHWEARHENGRLNWAGEFERGLKHGWFKFWDRAGNKLAEGPFVEGRREGDWIYWRGGRRVELTFKEGVLVG